MLILSKLADQSTLATTVNQVQVYGATRTRQNFLDPIIKPIIDAGQGPGSNLGEILENLRIASNKLDRFGSYISRPQLPLIPTDN